MAKNKKWNKVIARIQALEDALAGLLSGRSASQRKKAKKAKAKTASRPKRKAVAKKSAPKPAKPRAKKSAAPARKPRKRNPRVAESALILPQPPVPAL
ncbi:MAG: hypothetical protein J0I19_04095 [Alphaproteobacteria bacterium]|nr:hypothetical protein [Alphaproteobacteria bacterium]